MMLMPAGLPALVILAPAELAHTLESEKMAIAKTLTLRNAPQFGILSHWIYIM